MIPYHIELNNMSDITDNYSTSIGKKKNNANPTLLETSIAQNYHPKWVSNVWLHSNYHKNLHQLSVCSGVDRLFFQL